MSIKKQNKLKSFRSKMLETRQQALEFFSGTEFRYEQVGFIKGCMVINDSRSCDLEGTIATLEMTNTPVHLILGDVNTAKLIDFASREIRLKVVTLGVFGETNHTLNADIVSMVDKATYSPKLDDVIKNMIKWLKPGETLLFSPAANSLDLYEDYRQRGMHLNKIIQPYLD